MLEVRNLNAWYGESHILHGMDFDVGEGEVVTLLGRNGAGKTTTMKSIMGMVGRREGSIKFNDRQTIKLASNAIARLGIAFCPEERGIFASLDVEENLMLPPQVAPGGALFCGDPGGGGDRDAPAAGGAGRPAVAADLRALSQPARAPEEPGH